MSSIDIKVFVDARDLSLWNINLCQVLEKSFSGQVRIDLSKQDRPTNHHPALANLLSLEKSNEIKFSKNERQRRGS